MFNPGESGAAGSDIRFLEYRLQVISEWPPSARKQVMLEAVSRRLATIARSTAAGGPLHNDVLASSCRLLDGVFYGGPAIEEEEEHIMVR